MKNKTKVVICFDVEDYTSPESVGMDDIPKWLAEIMTEEGVTGSFFVIGEKARSLEKRKRYDVIQAMAKHDIGSHSNRGSIHPTITESLEKAEWKDGIKEMEENEAIAFNDLERIFGQKPNAFARHGGSYGPQLIAALGKMNAGYVYSPIGLPKHNAVWFCNALNFYGINTFGSFDDAYYRDDLFNPLFLSLEQNFEKLIEGLDVVTFFANHPSKIRSIQYWDFNYFNGANPGPNEWKTPELRPLETMKTAKRNFRKLIQFLQRRKDIELTTYRHIVNDFSGQKKMISKGDLNLIAKRMISLKKIIIEKFYSPAEIFSSLAFALSECVVTKTIPEKISLTRPFGPMSIPLETPQIREVSTPQGLYLANQAREYIQRHQHLPSQLYMNQFGIGTGTLFLLFCQLFTDLMSGKTIPTYKLSKFQAYPDYNLEQIIKEVRSCKSWPIHRENLDIEPILQMTKLQLWTLKPAFQKEVFD